MNTVYCQSCGMPMVKEELFGTEKDGGKSAEFCVYCYENGEYRQPDMPMEDMITLCVPYLKEDGMGEDEARELLIKDLPRLKRWNGR